MAAVCCLGSRSAAACEPALRSAPDGRRGCWRLVCTAHVLLAGPSCWPANARRRLPLEPPPCAPSTPARAAEKRSEESRKGENAACLFLTGPLFSIWAREKQRHRLAHILSRSSSTSVRRVFPALQVCSPPFLPTSLQCHKFSWRG